MKVIQSSSICFEQPGTNVKICVNTINITTTAMNTFVGHVFVFLATLLTINAFPSSQQNTTCTVDGRDYGPGDTIGDPCNGCVCTQFGAMCQLRMCPPAQCQDKVRLPGECCDTCPSVTVSTAQCEDRVRLPGECCDISTCPGPNCAYTGSRGTSLVPADGCRYSDTMVCFCYEDGRTNTMMSFCVPALPGEILPACAITSPNTL